MIVSNNNISYENAWQALKSISQPAMLIVAIIHLGKLLFELGEKQVFGPLGIGGHEFEALFNIIHHEKPTPTLLSQYSLMPPAKITRVLDKLEQRGAILRNPIKGDRRSYSLAITEKGRELFKQAIERFKQSGQNLSDEVGSENIKQLSRIIISIIENLGVTQNEDTNIPG
ncbi:MAG: MarR family transcriptional regulator [Spirochaetales bacterium]|nr:MarR family transcriptional regulator [Spirochaetales bacterium]